MTSWPVQSAAATLTVVAMLSGAPVANVVRVEPTFNQRVDANATPGTANPRVSGIKNSWAKIARMISSAVRDARDEGNPTDEINRSLQEWSAEQQAATRFPGRQIA